ncbi:MAG: hypothetical protein JW818_23570 [Pirellulales bacterium]|nr:hypothetical protein [Pirellulales bacterium]
MRTLKLVPFLLLVLVCVVQVGCQTPCVPHEQRLGPPYDRPFPLGQVTDSFWETQQSNAEASDFVFYDHEFEGKTAKLTPAGRSHLQQVAVRLAHVPYPIIVEQTPGNADPRLDGQRRQTVVDQLTALGLQAAEPRVVVAPMLAEGITAIEGESGYYSTLNSGNFEGGTGRRFNGTGGVFR